MSAGEAAGGRFAGLAARLEAVLPAQAPIRDFVHHNTLHAFQHLPFREAVAAAAARTGAQGFASAAAIRNQIAQGRISRADLDAVLAEQPALDAGAALAGAPDGLTRRDLYRAALQVDLAPVDRATLRWLIEDGGALDAPGRRDLWHACLEVLDVQHLPVHPESLRATDQQQAVAQTAVSMLAQATLDALLGDVGPRLTLADLLRRLTGQNPFDNIRPRLIGLFAAFLDLGFAPWPLPNRQAGFYRAWRELAGQDPVWGMIDLAEWHQVVERLPDDAEAVLVQELRLLGLPETVWEDYLERLALTWPGWAGMFLQREHRPPMPDGTRVRLVDFLAVLLVMERAFAHGIFRRRWRVEPTLSAVRAHFLAHPAEFVVRQALFGSQMPEHLVTKARRLTRQATFTIEPPSDDDWLDVARHIAAWRRRLMGEGRRSAHADAWPLFRLALALDLDATAIRMSGGDGVTDWLRQLADFDSDCRGYVALLAYERHYREPLFAALAANRMAAASAPEPSAQLVFCMDDREEGIRRHLEEVRPSIETFGAAGFFGVAMYWRGLDDVAETALCPVVVTPAHHVHEVAAPSALAQLPRHRQRRARLDGWRRAAVDGGRRGPFGATLATTLAGAPSALLLAWRVLAPARWGQTLASWRRRVDPPVQTRLIADAPEQGFPLPEQVARVANLLRTIGLTRHFAPLVGLLGHGSTSLNNPHQSAYDCGACSGRHGGPNARAFAVMANAPAVRAALAGQGILIPASTWFLGGERNTADETTVWYDLDLLPPEHAAAVAALSADLAEAGRRHARERCRRLASAPPGASAEGALRHLFGRSMDFAEARPELGHATNAVALIGRRRMSRGLFLDRRAFLISYDPDDDGDGQILEAILLAAGPVGAGINLEYYFSTVNNPRYGCGTKTVHNVVGFTGVMEGAESDLRTGLPSQMIEIHEAMRLLVIVEQTVAVASAIYARAPVIRELVGQGWLVLAAASPEDGQLSLFDPGRGWQDWTDAAARSAVPVARTSAEWLGEARLPLSPARLVACPEPGR